MATPNVGILTNAGKNLIDQVNAGQTKITFSKIVFSSMNNNQLTDEQIKVLTTVAPQEVVVNNPEVTLDNGTGETRIRATGNNKALTDGVYVKTYAVYAKDDSGNEILYGITVSPNPNYLPEYDGVTPQAVTYSYKVNISNTSNITFTNSNDVYVSDTDLAEALQPYAKTVDVNQQLDKKVNVADMRKPASDVAGIDEVSTLQTQVNNSAVGTNLLLGTSSSEQSYTGDFSTVPSWGNTRVAVNAGSTYTYSIYLTKLTGSFVLGFWTYDSNGAYITWVHSDYYSSLGKVSYTFTVPSGVSYISPHAAHLSDDFACIAKEEKLELGSHATDWCPNPEDKVNVSDMRKPASDVAGIEEVNAKADDSKVAHLSGANNFDTVPTVKNNPLLLASSLPSDLARTGQANTFTAAQTFSIAPTITDASKDKGDNQAATMADLKSVENSAWHQLNNDKCLGGTLLYKIDQSSKRIYLLYSSNYSNRIYKRETIADFSSIVNKIKTISGKCYVASPAEGDSTLANGALYVDLSIGSPASIVSLSDMSGGYNCYYNFIDGTYFTYDSLVNN